MSCARTAPSSSALTSPGINADEVKIEIEDDILTISGEHEQHAEAQYKHYVRHERRCGSFSRSITLPADVDANKITATTHDGVVEVTIPLPEESKEGEDRDHPDRELTLPPLDLLGRIPVSSGDRPAA
jgi:HSP20 family molecular chaperone IbpA